MVHFPQRVSDDRAVLLGARFLDTAFSNAPATRLKAVGAYMPMSPNRADMIKMISSASTQYPSLYTQCFGGAGVVPSRFFVGCQSSFELAPCFLCGNFFYWGFGGLNICICGFLPVPGGKPIPMTPHSSWKQLHAGNSCTGILPDIQSHTNLCTMVSFDPLIASL